MLQELQNSFWQACEHLLLYHTNPWELDEALCAAGYAMGPCEAQDLIGLDKVLGRSSARPVPILPRMVAEGRMGKIGGVGYYRYPGGGGAVIDPLIEDLILEEAWFAKVTRSPREDGDLVHSLDKVVAEHARKLVADGMPKGDLHTGISKALHYPLARLSI